MLFAFVLALLAPAIDAGDNAAPVPIAAHAAVLPDPSGALDINGALRKAAQFRAPIPGDYASEQSRTKTAWLRFRLVDDRLSAQPRAIVVFADIARIDLYVPKADGAFDHLQAGMDVYSGDDSLVHRVLLLPAAAYGPVLYMRVSGYVSPDALPIVPARRAVQNVLERNTYHVFFIGYFLAIFALYLMLFAILRQPTLLQYSIVVASIAALTYVDSGSIWNAIGPTTLHQRNVTHDLIIYAYFILLAAFSAAFLRLRTSDRPAFVAVVAATALNALDLVNRFVVLPDWIANLGDYATYAYFIVLCIAAIRAWRRGFHPASFFALGIAAVLFGYAVNGIVSSLPLLDPLTTAAAYAFEAGIALEGLLLGIAVAEGIRETARDYERLLEQSAHLEDLALKDPLTAVFNRRAFDEGLMAAWRAALANRDRLGLLMIDVDHFKRYNDRYGHQAGDDCLQQVAQACQSCVRSDDLFARYGGEEFAAIVPGATQGDLTAMAQRMREAVLALNIEHDVDYGRVTISIGGATRPAPDLLSPKVLIATADKALYQAKQAGRNSATV